MIRAAAVLLLSAAPAFAEGCPAVITGIDWDNGSSDTVTSRASDMLVLDSEIAMGGEERYPIRFRLQAGVIPLWNSGADGPVSTDWATPLPAAADLVPGASFTLGGSQHAWGEVEPVRLTLTVQAVEMLTVAGCQYEVARIGMRRTLAHDSPTEAQVWLHLPSLLPLREASAGTEEPWLREVVALR